MWRVLCLIFRNSAFMDTVIADVLSSEESGGEVEDEAGQRLQSQSRKRKSRAAVAAAAVDAFTWLEEKRGSPSRGWLGGGGWSWEDVASMRFEHPLAVSIASCISCRLLLLLCLFCLMLRVWSTLERCSRPDLCSQQRQQHGAGVRGTWGSAVIRCGCTARGSTRSWGASSPIAGAVKVRVYDGDADNEQRRFLSRETGKARFRFHLFALL
jgi:hypothetical protein